MINNKILNSGKTVEQYRNATLILGEEPGLFDTIHKNYPKIWDLYKEMKSLDWSEDEFDYKQCNLDFKNCPKEISDMMIKTLVWQWEADSVASRAIITLLAPFITSSELWAAWQRISDNEVVHAATYSEIVRMSFDNPHEVLGEILSIKETLSRLEGVGKVFSETYELAHKYSLGMVKNDQDLYNSVYLTIATLLMLERIQFMASFAITFTICGTGLFQPIGKAVQKIAQDELEVHCELDKEVIKEERKTERGKIAQIAMADRINQIFHEIGLSHIDIDFSQPAITNKRLKSAASLSAKSCKSQYISSGLASESEVNDIILKIEKELVNQDNTLLGQCRMTQISGRK